MDFLKRLVKGEFSLSFTFWNFLVLCTMLINQVSSYIYTFQIEVRYLVVIEFFMLLAKLIIACTAISALFFIQQKKTNDFWRTASLVLSVLNLIYLIHVISLFIPLARMVFNVWYFHLLSNSSPLTEWALNILKIVFKASVVMFIRSLSSHYQHLINSFIKKIIYLNFHSNWFSV